MGDSYGEFGGYYNCDRAGDEVIGMEYWNIELLEWSDVMGKRNSGQTA